MTNLGPQVTQPKKGIHPLVWVGVGCGALVIVGLAFIVVGGVFVGRQVKDLAQGLEDNPVMTAAKVYAAIHPEVEVVGADEANETVIFRNTKTGEELTVDFEDVQEGRIVFRGAEGEVDMRFEEDEERGGGRLTVTGDGGSATFGSASAEDLPAWIPVYPGAEAEATYAVNTAQESSGIFTVTTTDSYAKLMDFYKAELQESGFEIEVQAAGLGVVKGGVLTARDQDQDRTVSVAVSTDGDQARAMITYNAKQE